MYTQQLKHLKIDVDTIKKNLVENSYVKDFAMIVHDRDEGVEEHLHVFLKFNQQKSIDYVAQLFEDKSNYIEFFNKGNFSETNGYLYLLHKTKNASNKHQYNIDELITADNSDIKNKIEGWITNYEQSLKKYQSTRRKTVVESILSDYAEQVIDYEELKQSLTNLELAKNQRLIKDINKVLVDVSYQNYVENKRYKDKKVIWIFGESGCGKSLMSQKIAEKFFGKNEIYVTSSNRDPFENYFKERAIILEEFRPNTNIDFNELLQLLDKTTGYFSAGSRYNNKKIMVELIIINTIFEPINFVDYDEPIVQLARRIDELYEINKEEIKTLTFNRNNNKFDVTKVTQNTILEGFNYEKYTSR